METQTDLIIRTLVLRIRELEDPVRILEVRVADISESTFTVNDPTPTNILVTLSSTIDKTLLSSGSEFFSRSFHVAVISSEIYVFWIIENWFSFSG